MGMIINETKTMKVTRTQLRENKQLNEMDIRPLMGKLYKSDGKKITYKGNSAKIVSTRMKSGNGVQLELDKPIKELAPNKLITINVDEYDKAVKIMSMIKETKTMKITRSQLKEIIREEIQKLSEKRIPKKGTPDDHQHKIAVDTVKNPNKRFFGGMDSDEAEEILKTKFGYSDSDIKKLKK